MRNVVFSEHAPKAIGPYSQAVVWGELLFCSGQLGIDPHTGKLAEGVSAQTHASMKNLGEVLKANGMDYANILKTTIFVADLKDFAAVNEAYGSYFDGDFPQEPACRRRRYPLAGWLRSNAWRQSKQQIGIRRQEQQPHNGFCSVVRLLLLFYRLFICRRKRSTARTSAAAA